ncbi:hypothetical protein C6P46_003340 [Rhodotorula mucilaginosa]|uniref:mannan endo-1,4-beta-mannosidase n=1 Tax=Rhodotorula mucilaginosa TaxID=5537 RepID=A0A9P7B729_RHOMI|nr:hypothetical protein C6P46_003340 [Rhodotorula mucilaginosa]
MSTGSVSAQRLPLLLLKSTTDAPCTQASTRMSSPRRLTRRKIEFSRLSRSRPQWEPSLGISYGTGKSIENALNTFKPDGDPAWDALDFAVFAARQYGIRLVLPLTDQYDYYHGGIPTCLRWRNLSATNHSPFYDLSSQVYGDFELYVRTLLNHTSPYTNLTLASDPTILAFETGNELGGWTGKHYPPPVAWTRSIAQLIKSLSPNSLVVSGSYGVRRDELSISEVDIVRLSRAASLAASTDSSSAPKAFLVGEYDWTNRTYLSWRFAWFLLLLPLLIAILITWATPKRCWPIRTTPLRILTCGASRCARRRKRANRGASTRNDSAASIGEQDLPSTADLRRRDTNEDLDKSFTPFASSDRLPILETSRADDFVYPPPRTPVLGTTTTGQSPSAASRLLHRPLTIKRWHVFPIPFLVLLPILVPLLIIYLPSPIGSFLSNLATDSRIPDSSTSPRIAGDLWWSLFGRTDSCDAYVQHNDGYTLHYPAFPAVDVEQSTSSFVSHGSGQSVLELTKHAWTVRGEAPFWLSGASGAAADELTWESLPAISCPQGSLKWPNGTSIE